MPELLVSIRDAEEAQSARTGGADWIDVKEPRNGPLGKALDPVLTKIADENENLIPLSAAMGEINGYTSNIFCKKSIEKYSIIKFGSASSIFPIMHERLGEIVRETQKSKKSLVMAAYGDFHRAKSPPPALFPSFCAQEGLEYLLIDTFKKDKSHLFSWLSIQDLGSIRDDCEKLGIKLALAGRLGPDQLPALKELAPHIVGLRSAVCMDGVRDNPISLERIRFWKSELA